MKTIHVSLGVIYRFVDTQVEVFMQKRDEDGPFLGMWEFPGGTIEDGETMQEALIREIDEEVGIQIEDSEVYFLKTFHTEVKNKRIRLNVHIIKTSQDKDLTTWFKLNGEFENIIPKNFEILDNLKEFFGDSENFVKVESLIWK